MVERQDEDEDEAGDGGERQEDPEEDEVDLLSQQLPVAQRLVDGVVLLLLLCHLKEVRAQTKPRLEIIGGN